MAFSIVNVNIDLNQNTKSEFFTEYGGDLGPNLLVFSRSILIKPCVEWFRELRRS